MKILIVDDDLSLRQMLGVTLTLDDRVDAVEMTATAAEALDVAADFRPDVVILDSVLGMERTDVGAHLRTLIPEARLISFSGMEREAPWADARVLKSGEGIEELKRYIFDQPPSTGEGTPPPVTDEELRRFIHDIRNPIGAIIGFTHILKTRDEKLSDDQQAEVVDALQRTAERLSSLVETFSSQRSQST